MAVHKISASDSSPADEPKKAKPAKAAKTPKVRKARVERAEIVAPKTDTLRQGSRMPDGLQWLPAIGRYFKGAWHELREVRWPTRKATWSLTVAVLGFSALLTVIILLLDAGYKFLFEIILK